MSDHAKISITLKAGGNTADPWVVVHADSVDEAHHLITQLVNLNVFNGVKQVSAQFASGQVTPAQAVNTVQQSMPGAQVIAGAPPADEMWAGMNTQPQYQGPPQGQVQQQYQQPPAQQLPASQTPPCTTCGGSTSFKSGTSKTGKAYKGYFCVNDKNHAPAWL